MSSWNNWRSVVVLRIRCIRTPSGSPISWDGCGARTRNIDDVTRHVAGRYIAEFGNAPKGGIAAAGKGGSTRQPRTVNHRLSVLTSYFAFRIRQDDTAGTGPWF